MTNLWGPTTNKGHLIIKILIMTMGFSWGHSMRWFFLSTGLKWNVEMLVFVEGGKPRNLYKNPWSKDIPTHIPHMTPGLGIEPVEQQGGECSCHSTIPSSHSVTMQGFATSIVIFGSSTKDGTQIITKIDGQNIFHTICHPYNSGNSDWFMHNILQANDYQDGIHTGLKLSLPTLWLRMLLIHNTLHQ